jgi:hypothetical protein
MSTTPIIGLGATFEFATLASPTTFTTLAGIDSVSFSGDKQTTVKTTTFATTNGVDTYIGATFNSGSCDVKGFLLPGESSQVALEAIYTSGAIVPMKVTYGTSSNSCTFTGIVESWTPGNFVLDKAATLDVKIQISGPRTFA